MTKNRKEFLFFFNRIYLCLESRYVELKVLNSSGEKSSYNIFKNSSYFKLFYAIKNICILNFFKFYKFFTKLYNEKFQKS